MSSRRWWRVRYRWPFARWRPSSSTSASSNIPVNLFDDILNIPYNETVGGGLAILADSFLFTGTWWVPSSTNLWGIDPGDPTHIASDRQLHPVHGVHRGRSPTLPGVYEPGLDYEFAGLLAAELPVSAPATPRACSPMTPPDVITGSTGFDRDIGFFAALMGNATDANGDPNGLFTNFFQVPLSGSDQRLHVPGQPCRRYGR